VKPEVGAPEELAGKVRHLLFVGTQQLFHLIQRVALLAFEVTVLPLSVCVVNEVLSPSLLQEVWGKTGPRSS
jgi:hypothetical protein